MCCGCFLAGSCPRQAARLSWYGQIFSELCWGILPASPPPAQGCSRIDINSSMDDDLFYESFLNGIFIVNVRQVFLLGRNTGKHMLGSHLFIILTCSALTRKSILPFNIESRGEDVLGENSWRDYSFRGGCWAERALVVFSALAGKQKLLSNELQLNGWPVSLASSEALHHAHSAS